MMSFNPLAILQERQCSHVYDSIDSGRAANAIKECDALLAKEPNLHLASALKSVALCRANRKDEANEIANRLIKLDGAVLHTSILNVIAMALSSLDRQGDEAIVYDNASKAHPNDVDLGAKACLAMTRSRQWQKMQQTALRTYKAAIANTKKGKETDDLYFWWSMQAYCLAAEDVDVQGYQLALPLAQRMIAKHIETKAFADRSDECMFLYARILQKSGKGSLSKALEVLSGEPLGRALCERSMTLSLLRRDIQKQKEDWRTIFSESVNALGSAMRNWTDVEDAVESAVKLAGSSDGGSDAVRQLQASLSRMANASKKDRTARLSQILLIRVARESSHQDLVEGLNFMKLLSEFFDDFSSKACTYEDLSPAVRICSEQEKQTFLQKVASISRQDNDRPFEDDAQLNTVMNALKLERLLQDTSTCDAASEVDFALRCLRFHVRSQTLVKDLLRTEMQPCDDFALLCAQVLLHAAYLEPNNDIHLRLALTVLRECLERSPKAYRLRIIYVRLLLRSGAVNEARLQFNALGVKGVQYDTLGWTIAENFAHHTLLLRPGSEEEREYLALLRQMRGVWREGQVQVPAMACKALEHGTFSRVEEILKFGERLTWSVARHSHITESLRLECMSIGTGAGLERLKAEFVETQKAIAEGKGYDQRDHRVMPDYLSSPHTNIAALTLSSPADTCDSRVNVHALFVAKAFGLELIKQVDDETVSPSQGPPHLNKIAETLQSGHSLREAETQDAYVAMYKGMDEAIKDFGRASYIALGFACSALELTHFLNKIEVETAVRISAMDGLQKIEERAKLWLEDLRTAPLNPSDQQSDGQWFTLLASLTSSKHDSMNVLVEEGRKAKARTITAIEAILERIASLEQH